MASEYMIELCVRTPNTLQDLCMDILVDMLIHLNGCEIHYDFPWLETESNPFRGLQPWIIEKVVERFKKKLNNLDVPSLRFVKKELIKILFCRKFIRIDLRGFNFQMEDLADVVQMIKNTKSDLKLFGIIGEKSEEEKNSKRYGDRKCVEFWLNSKNAISYLNDYLTALNSLTHLFMYDLCNDDFLKTVGSNCPNLVVLQAESESVHVSGIKGLCFGIDQSKQCQRLEEIYLCGSYSGWCGNYVMSRYEDLMTQIEILLKNLLQLSVIWNVDRYVGKVLKKLRDESSNYTCNLTQFKIVTRRRGDAENPIIFNICPRLRKLHIDDPSKECLQEIGNLKNLKELAIEWHYSRDYSGGNVSFLQRIGENLEVLHLCHFESIDFDIIGEFCPHLRQLHITYSFTENITVVSKPTFEELEILTLKAYSHGSPLDPQLCVKLISCCFKLNRLDIDCCDEFDRIHLQEIVLNNPLTNLRSVKITSLHLSIIGTSTEGGILNYCNL